MITAILTGDIEDSSNIDTRFRGKLSETLYSIIEDFKSVSPDVCIDIFRGDSFQIEVKEPERAVRLAILLRAGLRAATPILGTKPWDARISIGLGSVSYRTDRLGTSDGEAFVNSGHGLDEIGKRKLTVRTPWADFDESVDLLTEFVDDIVSNWTIPQSAVVYQKLLTNKSQKEIADDKKQTKANISIILGKSKASLIRKYIKRCETLLKDKLQKI
ncbi:MAG: hypothetical protein IKP81_07265 [Paludibacteraceae bacterium]|nr:hypothetical protein [Paludibacteraceae bacterium]